MSLEEKKEVGMPDLSASAAMTALAEAVAAGDLGAALAARADWGQAVTDTHAAVLAAMKAK